MISTAKSHFSRAISHCQVTVEFFWESMKNENLSIYLQIIDSIVLSVPPAPSITPTLPSPRRHLQVHPLSMPGSGQVSADDLHRIFLYHFSVCQQWPSDTIPRIHNEFSWLWTLVHAVPTIYDVIPSIHFLLGPFFFFFLNLDQVKYLWCYKHFPN